MNNTLYSLFKRISKRFQMKWLTTFITGNSSMDPINRSFLHPLLPAIQHGYH